MEKKILNNCKLNLFYYIDEYIYVICTCNTKIEVCSREAYVFYAPGLKGPQGASSVLIVCLSVHVSVQ